MRRIGPRTRILHRLKNTRIRRQPQPPNLVRKRARHRPRLRRLPLRNHCIQHRGDAEDVIKRPSAVHLVCVGEEHVVGEVAPDGGVVHYGTDVQGMQVGAVTDSGVQ